MGLHSSVSVKHCIVNRQIAVCLVDVAQTIWPDGCHASVLVFSVIAEERRSQGGGRGGWGDSHMTGGGLWVTGRDSTDNLPPVIVPWHHSRGLQCHPSPPK